VILYGSRAAGMFVRDDSDWDVWLFRDIEALARNEGLLRGTGEETD